jgi:hypothetical protein
MSTFWMPKSHPPAAGQGGYVKADRRHPAGCHPLK